MNRHPAGTGKGGQFATAACPRVYAMLDTMPLEDEVTKVDISGGTGAAYVIRVDEGRYHAVSARRCPHGHFARYARTHCKKGCAR